jgi:hypothetical protein
MRRFMVPTLLALFLCASNACTGGSSGTDAGVGGGAGNPGPCPDGQEVVQRNVGTEAPCDLQGDPDQCGAHCVTHCENQGYGLGSQGSACARLPDAGPTCRCLCAGCGEP